MYFYKTAISTSSRRANTHIKPFTLSAIWFTRSGYLGALFVVTESH